jgi:hypothetical protein
MTKEMPGLPFIVFSLKAGHGDDAGRCASGVSWLPAVPETV